MEEGPPSNHSRAHAPPERSPCFPGARAYPSRALTLTLMGAPITHSLTGSSPAQSAIPPELAELLQQGSTGAEAVTRTRNPRSGGEHTCEVQNGTCQGRQASWNPSEALPSPPQKAAWRVSPQSAIDQPLVARALAEPEGTQRTPTCVAGCHRRSLSCPQPLGVIF